MSSDYCTLTFFFFNDTATTEIYTLSLHDALPISWYQPPSNLLRPLTLLGNRIYLLTVQLLNPEVIVSNAVTPSKRTMTSGFRDRKSTRLNSSHSQISYAVFCLKKKKLNYHATAIE